MSINVLKIAGVAKKTGISERQIYVQMKAGTFPRSITLTAGKNASKGWVECEIDEWITSRMAER
ncbi:MAG: AlpA family phage regulatory protein [Pseudomonadales bacterium]|nr:AlpA family phage regulatory protein [Pseudomonadales bacterium]